MVYFGSKKTFYHPKADVQARKDFQTKLQGYEACYTPIIYVDESGFAHDMPRLYGYSVKGKRCYGQHDWRAKARTNVIGAQLKTPYGFICCLIDISLKSRLLCFRLFQGKGYFKAAAGSPVA